MSTKAEKERQKQIQDKCQALLNQMLRDEDNKYCVDCDAKGPRWASWNLGIFLCIRCAGIHRNLGVHISKVRSVNLDTWTPEQVVSLQQMGNSRARAVYEANLPDNFRRPQADSPLEAFVRAKYEHKKYIAREWVPPPLPKVNWDKELDEEAERTKKKKRESKITSMPVTNSTRKVLENIIPQPLPKPSTSPKPQRLTAPPLTALPQACSALSQDLLGLDTPVQESVQPVVTSAQDDMFTNFLSVTVASSNQRSAEEESFFNQPQPQGTQGGKLTKDSILALYGKNQPAPAPPPQVNTFPMQGGFMPISGFQSASPFAPINGMAPVQGALWGGREAMGSAAASNPFYNMAASSAVPSQLQQVPISYSQGNRLAQQMGTLNLGTPANTFQPTVSPPLWQ